MALRNIGRRRAEAVLVVAGALLGTAIITSSFVVGDVIEGSFADVARTQLGPVDITLTAGQGGDARRGRGRGRGRRHRGIDGLLPVTTTTGDARGDRGGHAAVPQVRSSSSTSPPPQAFGADPRITGLADAATPAADEIVVNATHRGAARASRPATPSRLHAYGCRRSTLSSARSCPRSGLAGYGGAIVAPGTHHRAGRRRSAVGWPHPRRTRLLVSLDGGVFDTRALSDAAVADLRARRRRRCPASRSRRPRPRVLDDAERRGRRAHRGVHACIGLLQRRSPGSCCWSTCSSCSPRSARPSSACCGPSGSRAGGSPAPSRSRARSTRSSPRWLGAVAGLGIGWLVAVVAGPIFGAARGHRATRW